MNQTIIYPKLTSLKQKLNIKKINTGRTFTHNNSLNGIVFNDREALHAMGRIDGKVVLKSGLEMTDFQYRGQIKDYPTCNANLYRETNANESEIFLQICRTIAFERFLDKHPYIQLLKMNTEIYINNTAIAQHYELQTPYLDLTSNFDVASFFATCEYDPSTKSYQPYTNTQKLGVIYMYNEMMNLMIDDEDMKFEYLGWQGLPRPEEQRGSIYHLKHNEDFNTVRGVKKYFFQHSKRVSEKIWNQFNKGKTLFPNDVASDLANQCKSLTTFTKEELEIAEKRFEEWTGHKLSTLQYIEFMETSKIGIVESSSLNWGEIMNIQESYWLEKMEKTFSTTRSRMAMYPV
jgi:hypothetical protein